jgi:hypothetical protein
MRTVCMYSMHCVDLYDGIYHSGILYSLYVHNGRTESTCGGQLAFSVQNLAPCRPGHPESSRRFYVISFVQAFRGWVCISSFLCQWHLTLTLVAPPTTAPGVVTEVGMQFLVVIIVVNTTNGCCSGSSGLLVR